MDIEGGEPKALAGVDIERFKPRLACIEVVVRSGAPRRAERLDQGFGLDGL